MRALKRVIGVSSVAVALMGGAAVQAEVKDYYTELHYGSSSVGDSIDASSRGFRIAAGAMLNTYLGLEVGYADLGSFQFTAANGVEAEWQAKASDLSLMVQVPLNPGTLDAWPLRFRLALGLARWGVDLTTDQASDNSSGYSSRLGGELSYRFGAALHDEPAELVVNRRWEMELVAGLYRYTDVGDAARNKNSVDLAQFGLRLSY